MKEVIIGAKSTLTHRVASAILAPMAKPSDDIRDQRINVRMSRAEWAALLTTAAELGVTPAALLRRRGLAGLPRASRASQAPQITRGDA